MFEYIEHCIFYIWALYFLYLLGENGTFFSVPMLRVLYKKNSMNSLSDKTMAKHHKLTSKTNKTLSAELTTMQNMHCYITLQKINHAKKQIQGIQMNVNGQWSEMPCDSFSTDPKLSQCPCSLVLMSVWGIKREQTVQCAFSDILVSGATPRKIAQWLEFGAGQLCM